MNFYKACKLAVFLAVPTLLGAYQQPIAVNQVGIDGKNTGSQIDYFSVTTNGTPVGDTYYCTAWASNSLLSSFPNPSGLPITCTWNDGSQASPDPVCSGYNLGLAQLSKLPPLGTPANSGNTLLTGYPCYGSYSIGGVQTAPGGSWSDTLTWKNAPFTYINNVLRMMMFRQNNAGTQFGPSSSVISFDAGKHAIDFGRWQGYTVTAASCAAGSAAVTLSSATSAGGETLVSSNVVFIHNVGSGFDGQFTLTSVVGSVIHYATTCPGTTPTSGFVALAAADGSAPWGPGNAGGYNLQWPSSGSSNPMGLKAPIVYGQDGTWFSGIEPVCDPALGWICFISSDESAGGPVIMGRYPAQCDATYCGEFDNSAYEWYKCSTVNGAFPGVGTCDFTQAGNRTSTLALATNMLTTGGPAGGMGVWPGQRLGMTFMPAFHSYLLTGVTRDQSGSGASKMSWWWRPHPWGPWNLVGQSQCSENSSSAPYTCGPGFTIPLLFQATGTSSSPPAMGMRYSTDMFVSGGGYSTSGNAFFGEIDTVLGKPAIGGMARRGGFLQALNNAGTTSQLGMGHRFTSGQMAGAIPRGGISSAITPQLITGYANCRVITVSASMVAGGVTLPGYPLILNLTGSLNIPDLRTVANGGLINSTNAYDVGFGPDCSGVGPMLKWELEPGTYSPTTGDAVFYVNTTVNSGATSTVGLYYTGSQSTFQSTASAVWDANFKAVYHMESAANPIHDSTTSGLNMAPQNTPTSVAGQIDGAVNFVTTSTQWATATGGAAVTTFPLTIECWAKLASATLSGDQVCASISDPATLNEYWLGYLATNQIRAINNSVSGGARITACTITPDTAWHHIAATFTNANTAAVVMDGVAISCSSSGPSSTPAGLTSTNVGGFVFNTSTAYGQFGGIIDEVRFSNIIRSTGWLATVYNNGIAPATYLSVGAKVTPGTPSTVFTKYAFSWWYDGWDHGGDTHATSRPYFMDVLSQGLKSFSVYKYNGVFWTNQFGAGVSLTAPGVTLTGAGDAILSNFTDTDNVFTANSSWSALFVLNPTSGNRWMYLTPGSGTTSTYVPDLLIEPSGSDLCVKWAGVNSVCTNTSPITTSTYQMYLVTASANTSGLPTVKFYIGAGGTVTEISGSGVTVTGSTTPTISSGDTYWFGSASTGFGGFTGTYGEIGVATGVVPSNAAIDIYRAMRVDWARTGRCSVTSGVCTNF